MADPASGRCRVVCFSPRHDLTLAEMDAAAVRMVVDAWAGEVDGKALAASIGRHLAPAGAAAVASR